MSIRKNLESDPFTVYFSTLCTLQAEQTIRNSLCQMHAENYGINKGGNKEGNFKGAVDVA